MECSSQHLCLGNNQHWAGSLRNLVSPFLSICIESRKAAKSYYYVGLNVIALPSHIRLVSRSFPYFFLPGNSRVTPSCNTTSSSSPRWLGKHKGYWHINPEFMHVSVVTPDIGHEPRLYRHITLKCFPEPIDRSTWISHLISFMRQPRQGHQAHHVVIDIWKLQHSIHCDLMTSPESGKPPSIRARCENWPVGPEKYEFVSRAVAMYRDGGPGT